MVNIMTKRIFIIKTEIWGKSYKILEDMLGYYYTPDFDKADLVFNMGCNQSSSFEKIMINKRIDIMRDKIQMNILLDELDIRHPKTYYYPFNKLPKSKEECLIKKRFGQRGTNVIFTTFNKLHIQNLYSDDYIQKYIPFEREYRVGIDFRRVLGIREKVGISKIRNSKSCVFETIRGNKKLEKFAWKVKDKFNVDFTGIDI